MAYIQNNPFSRKTSSPLKHNLRDKRSGDAFVHYHKKHHITGEDTDSIYSSDRQVIRGSEDFGKRRNRAAKSRVTNTKRLSDEMGGGRATEKNLAMDYARQISDMYNRGELTGGNFVADDFDKRSSKLSIKDGTVKIKPRYKSIGESRDYNVTYADEAEGYDANIGYTRPETQYTPEQIYEMMNQGGGQVSIVDGIGFVAGNPGEATRAGFDEVNRIRPSSWQKFKNQYETYNEGDEFVPFDERVSPNTGGPEKILNARELREKMLADRKAKILASRKTEPISRKSSSPFYKRGLKSSPLNQNHDDDTRSGNEFVLNPDFNYNPEVVTTTEGEWVIDPNNPEQMMQTNVQDVSITGTRNQPEVITSEGSPNPPVNPNPEGLSQEELNQNFTNFCLENPTDPKCQGFNKREGIEIDDTDIQNIQRETINYRPIDPPEIIEELDRPDRFRRDSAALKGKGLEFDLPSMSLPQLRSARKKCGTCKQRDLISRMILALGGGI